LPVTVHYITGVFVCVWFVLCVVYLFIYLFIVMFTACIFQTTFVISVKTTMKGVGFFFSIFFLMRCQSIWRRLIYR